MSTIDAARAAHPSIIPFPRWLLCRHLLGRPPIEDREYRADRPYEWPKDRTGLEYLHRGLPRMLAERGGTPEAAEGLQRDLEDGRIRTVAIDIDDGKPHPIQPELWRAVNVTAEMYWTGRAATGADRRGDIYLITTAEHQAAPEPIKADPERSQPDWWPRPAQTLTTWAMDPVVVREAERRLKAAGVRVTEVAKERAMEAMASEAGRTWAGPSIGATRRKGR